MAYRKSETTIAAKEARKAKLIAAAIDLMLKGGWEAATTPAIAKRAKLSEGLIYNYFADVTELRAAVVAQLLAQELELLRGLDLVDGIRAWARSLSANYRAMSTVGTLPVYREGIKAELLRKLRAAGVESPTIACALVYGGVLDAAGTLRPRDEGPLLASLMRACGLRARVAA